MTLRANDLAVQRWQQLLRYQKNAISRLSTDLGNAGTVSLGDYDVLYQLVAAGGTMRMSELAEATVIARSSCTRIVDRLVGAGLVERSSDENDARTVVAGVTPAGKAALRRAAVTHLKGIDVVFASRLSAQDLAALGRILDRLGAGVDRGRGSSS